MKVECPVRAEVQQECHVQVVPCLGMSKLKEPVQPEGQMQPCGSCEGPGKAVCCVVNKKLYRRSVYGNGAKAEETRTTTWFARWECENGGWWHHNVACCAEPAE